MNIRPFVTALLALLVLTSRTAGAEEISGLVGRIVIERREALDPVINRLVYLDSQDAALRVARLLAHPSPSVRSKAAWVLGFLQAPVTEQALHRAVLDPHWEVRRDAVYALGRLSATGAASTIATRLKDTSRPVQLEAARVLGALGDESTAPALREALGAIEDDAALEVSLLTALGRLGDEDSIAIIRESMSSGGEEVRLAALRALVQLEDGDAVDEILRRLRHEEGYVRRDAALLLADVEAPWAAGALEEALSSEEDPWVAIGVAEALTAQGGDRGLGHLAEVSATSEDPRLKQQAVEALGRQGIRGEDLKQVRLRMALKRLRSMDLPVEALARELLALDVPFDERVALISERFRGVPYVQSPLGEGGGYDPGPLYRSDGVDCLTLVEQVIALAHARNPEDIVPILNDVRYQAGVVAFGERNHLMEHQWLPNNLSKGWIRDITREVGGDLVEIAHKEVTRESWENRRGVDLPLDPEEIPLGTASLPIIPIESISEVMDRIPQGAILVVVRADFRSRPYRVTHLGFVFEKNGEKYLRHAARVHYKSVVDERLSMFLRRNRGYKSWPVTGFHILFLQENLLRADAIARDHERSRD